MKNNITTAQQTNEVTQRELKNKETSYNAALEGIVLLENNGVLPLKPCRVAIFGYGADRTIKGGVGSGEVNERHNTTINEGLTNAGFEIVSKEWITRNNKNHDDAYNKYVDDMRGLMNLINALDTPFIFPDELEINDSDMVDADIAIYVVTRQAGEGADKKIENGDFDLTKIEIESIKKLGDKYNGVIVAINSGSYMDLTTIKDANVSALIFFCQQGMEGGRAFADLITGKKNFSGKLTDTWALRYDDIPYSDEYSYKNGKPDEYYKEDIYVGYRFFETYEREVMYHFGYGLSYTKFDMKLNNYSYDNKEINLEVSVKNIGKYAGKEVVEVYSTLPNGKINKEAIRLVSFAKSKEINPIEEDIVKINFNLEYLASYFVDSASYIVEKGNYVIRIGNCINSLSNSLVLNVDEDIILTKNKNICPLDCKMDLLQPDFLNQEVDIEGIDVLNIKASDIETKIIDYNSYQMNFSNEVNEILNKLKVKDMINICGGSDIFAMLNGKGVFTPGTVGRTTDKYEKYGLINLNLSDGPAGLRILREFAITDKGKVKFVPGNLPFAFMDLLPEWMSKILSAKAKHKHYYQYCTSFPVATAIAQSWNLDLAEEIGKAISIEMDEYNITYFLAPGMNIHKNPLCGRNFEYYSEDPVLSGKIASSIVKGVESIKGCYATIKHFACNNAEYERMGSNSHVGERALREIYLRGFEIAVKEGGASSVMTSYNKINGTFTANIKDIVTDALRCEWGFDGVVMTDWSSTENNRASNGYAIHAGNDLIMPGNKKVRKLLMKEYKKGYYTLDELKHATANIIKETLESNVYKKYHDELNK